MADSIRQQIVDAVDTRLKAILKSAGYETDLGKNIFAWRATNLENSELPGAIWRDTDCDDSNATIGSIGYHLHSLTMEVDLRAADGATTPASLRTLVTDLQKAIGADVTWGGLAIRTTPMKSPLIVEQEEKIIGGANVTFAIEFYTKKWDPCNQ